MSKLNITTDMLKGALRYAAADKSDPFAFGRAMTHMRNGIASYATKDGRPGYYDAEETTEPRRIDMPNGQVLEWDTTTYKNVVRP